MILRSFSDYNHLIELSNDGSYKDAKGEKIQGYFIQLKDNSVFFYRKKELLYLNLNGKNEFKISSGSQAIRDRINGNDYRFTLKENGINLLTFEYTFDKDEYIFDDDPSGFIEEEDFNFGLFLRATISNPQRQDQIFR